MKVNENKTIGIKPFYLTVCHCIQRPLKIKEKLESNIPL